MACRERPAEQARCDLLHQRAGGRANHAGPIVAHGLVPPVDELLADRKRDVRMVEHRPAVAGEDHSAAAGPALVRLAIVVAPHAVPVEDRLNVAREVQHVRHAGDRRDGTGGLFDGHQAIGDGHFLPPLVTSDATERLARLDRQEAMHSFDGQVVGVQSHEEQASHGRDFEVGRAVRLDGHRAEDSFEREGPAVAERVHPAGVVDGLGQRFQDEQLLDLAGGHAGHVAPHVHVGKHELSGGPGGIDSLGEDPLSRAGH